MATKKKSESAITLPRQAGPVLDAWIAEHVMGWTAAEPRALPPFSTELAAAWLIVDKICDSGFRLQLDGSRLWLARFYKSAAHTLETRAFSATAGTPSLAICLAAQAGRNPEAVAAQL